MARVRTTADLGASIRAARRRRGWTQAELADRSGVGRQWLVGVESGRNRRAEIGLVLRVLDAADVTLSVGEVNKPGDGAAATSSPGPVDPAGDPLAALQRVVQQAADRAPASAGAATQLAHIDALIADHIGAGVHGPPAVRQGDA